MGQMPLPTRSAAEIDRWIERYCARCHEEHTPGTHEVANMDRETMERRQRATATFALRVIAAEQAHGVIRPDARARALLARLEAK